jgi:hypothetical protein
MFEHNRVSYDHRQQSRKPNYSRFCRKKNEGAGILLKVGTRGTKKMYNPSTPILTLLTYSIKKHRFRQKNSSLRFLIDANLGKLENQINNLH